MIQGFDHAGITVSDLVRSVDFYTSVLGWEVVDTIEPTSDLRVRELVGIGDAVLEGAMLAAPSGDRLELLAYVHPAGHAAADRPCDAGTTHVALRVDDIEAAHRRVVEGGYPVVSGPVDFGGQACLYCRDPDGAILELVEKT